jgi:nicotinamidase-related amidase
MSATPPPRSTPHTALVLIDIQDGFHHPTHWGPSRSNPLFEHNAALLLNTYRSLVSATAATAASAPHKLVHVMHSSLSPESPLHASSKGFALQAFASALPGELVMTKSVNSSFIGTDLEAVLREHFAGEPGVLYCAGLSTDHCVSTTVRMAGNLGVADGVGKAGGPEGGEKGEVVLVEDATACWMKPGGLWDAETVHAVHVESLREFAAVAGVEEIVELWKGWAEGAAKMKCEAAGRAWRGLK